MPARSRRLTLKALEAQAKPSLASDHVQLWGRRVLPKARAVQQLDVRAAVSAAHLHDQGLNLLHCLEAFWSHLLQQSLVEALQQSRSELDPTPRVMASSILCIRAACTTAA